MKQSIQSVVVIAFGVGLGLVAAACPSTSAPAEDGDAIDDGEACDGGKSRGPSEQCCLSFGADACGANLFCAAFDGRTVPTCYVLNTRADGDACNDNSHCQSGGCEGGVCQAMAGQPCTREVGCAPFQGDAYVCALDAGDRRCVPASSTLGGFCSDASDCDSGHCVADHCTSGAAGAACDSAEDCATARCVSERCSTGDVGAECEDNSDCQSDLVCHETCMLPGPDDGCSTDADCAAFFAGCFAGQCVNHSEGEACDSDAECGLLGCDAGTCAATCTDSLVCLAQSLFGPTTECRDAQCTEVQELFGACSVDSDCATDTRGLVCSDEVCLLRAGMPCEAESMCASAVCAAVVANRCVRINDGRVTSRCDNDDDCAANEDCLPRALDECVGP